jgi:hypothetical protein
VVSVADIARSANGGLVSEVMCSICRPARRRAKT